MSDNFDLKAYIKEQALEVDKALNSYLPEKGNYMGNIVEAMRYCLFPGGKRFRPVIAIATAQMLGQKREVVMPGACAFELIHCFSLVHDDLPCMDNDAVRRGKPSGHIAFGEAPALLAGDGLSIFAFEVAAKSAEFLPADTALKIVKEVAQASGYEGMVGGQILDMDAQEHGADKKSILAVHRAKTGALIRGSIRVGALAGGATQQELEALTKYGEEIGLVFQITDDILDAMEDPDPISFPSLYGMEESKQMAQESTANAIKLLEPWGEKALPLRSLAEYLLYRKN